MDFDDLGSTWSSVSLELKARPQIDICTTYLHSSIIHKIQQVETTQTSINKWVDWFIRPMECYSVFERNVIVIHAIIWMNFGSIVSNERSQSQRTNVWFHRYEVLRKGKFTEAKSTIQATRDWGKGRMRSYCLMIQSFCLGWHKHSGDEQGAGGLRL
jgi:hypothetical protein